MKIIEIRNCLELRQKIKDSVVPVKVAYKFSRFFNALDKENQFFTEQLNNLIQAYGEKDDKGNFVLTDDKQNVLINKDKYEECIEKVQELNDLDVEVEYIPEFTLDELEKLGLSIQQINLLMPYIKME